MHERYPTRNPLDRIFLGITNLVIVFAGAVVLYHCVVTSINLPPYETNAVAANADANSALQVAAETSSRAACVQCLPASVVR